MDFFLSVDPCTRKLIIFPHTAENSPYEQAIRSQEENSLLARAIVETWRRSIKHLRKHLLWFAGGISLHRLFERMIFRSSLHHLNCEWREWWHLISLRISKELFPWNNLSDCLGHITKKNTCVCVCVCVCMSTCIYCYTKYDIR